MSLIKMMLVMVSVAAISKTFGLQIGRAVSRNAETDLVCRLLLEKKKDVVTLHKQFFDHGLLHIQIRLLLDNPIEPYVILLLIAFLQRKPARPPSRAAHHDDMNDST